MLPARSVVHRLCRRVPAWTIASRQLHQEKLKELPNTVEELKASFPFITKISVEFRDLDAMAHVNNCTYFQYFENVRVQHFTATIMPNFQFTPEGLSPVLADTWCSYRRPVELYDELLIGLRVENIIKERGEFQHRYAVWSTQLGTVAAQGGATCVFCDFDNGGRRSEIPQEWIDKLTA